VKKGKEGGNIRICRTRGGCGGGRMSAIDIHVYRHLYEYMGLFISMYRMYIYTDMFTLTYLAFVYIRIYTYILCIVDR
jgi:hypothetical protein